MDGVKQVYIPYYTETDAGKRAQLLAELKQSPECDPDELSLIRKIHEFRYGTGKKKTDRFLGECLNHIYLYRSQSPISIFAGKRIRDAKKELIPEDPAGPAAEAFLYQEYKNTALTYLMTCGDSDYASYFGIMKAGSDTKTARIVQDLWEMTDGFCSRFRVEEDFSLFTKAVKEAFFASRPDARDLFEAYGRKKGAAL